MSTKSLAFPLSHLSLVIWHGTHLMCFQKLLLVEQGRLRKQLLGGCCYGSGKRMDEVQAKLASVRQVQEADGKEVLEGHCRTDGMVDEGETLE